MPGQSLCMRTIVFASHLSEAPVAGEETLEDQIKDILEATEEDHTGKLTLCGPLYNTHRCHTWSTSIVVIYWMWIARDAYYDTESIDIIEYTLK